MPCTMNTRCFTGIWQRSKELVIIDVHPREGFASRINALRIELGKRGKSSRSQYVGGVLTP